MLRIDNKQLSIGCLAYQKIPGDHMLKLIGRAVDFTFINELLADSYCRDMGRPAKEPALMAKLLFLQYLYDLSDVKVIEEATYNLVWLWFLGLNPEDQLPEPSLLAKFRTQRLSEYSLDDIITEIVRQCVEKGIVKGSGISIDATHVKANTNKLVPERIMKHLAKRIFSALEKDLGKIPDEIDTQIPDWAKMTDHKAAKQMMKEYLEKVMAEATPLAGDEARKAIEESEEILSDERFILQKGIRSLVDKDARVGAKSRTKRFFGYKSEFMMTTDERIITAVHAKSGEYTDGKEFDSLLETTIKTGIQPKEIFGDKAYFRKDILGSIEAIDAEALIPVSASAYRINEEQFRYNKDSDQWFCVMGNHTVKKKRLTRKRNGRPEDFYQFYFDKELCLKCPLRKECMGKAKTRERRLCVTLHTAEFYAISQSQKTPEFKERYKKRAAHEWKNAEMKRFHGLARARGYGLRSVSMQAKLTAIAVNLKRIAALAAENAAVLFNSYLKSLFKADMLISKGQKLWAA